MGLFSTYMLCIEYLAGGKVVTNFCFLSSTLMNPHATEGFHILGAVFRICIYNDQIA